MAKRLIYPLLYALYATLVASTVYAVDSRSPESSQEITFPSISADKAKEQEYTAYLKRVIPRAFQRGVSGRENPTLVLERERQLLSVLSESADVIARERGLLKGIVDRIKLSVTIENFRDSEELVLSPEGRSQLQKVINLAVSKSQISDSILKQLRTSIKSLGTHSSQGILTGLIRCLPSDQQSQIFKFSFDNQIQALQSSLTDQMIRDGFRSSEYDQSSLTKDVLLAELIRIRETEKQIGVLGLALRLKGAEASEQPWTLALLRDRIADFKPEANELLEREVRKLLKPYLIKNATASWMKQEVFVIEEVPANLGLWRGVVNGDCCLQFAYGFSYSPAEKTFFVRNEKGELLFAVYATSVMINGEKALYIGDLGSASVSERYAEYLMRAFHSVLPNLGYKKLVFKSSGMHYQRFLDRIEISNATAIQSDLLFLDMESRRIIGEELVRQTETDYSLKHDLPNEHKVGSLYEPKPDPTLRVHVQIHSSNAFTSPRIASRLESSRPRSQLKVSCESLFTSPF